MLVEDDAEMAQAMCHVLERERHEVRLFTDASDALAALHGDALPDLIVLDLWTPTMNGWQFRLAQKNDPRLADIPLIAISADRSPHAAAIDADRFLPKPLSGSELLASVEDVLGTRAPAQTPRVATAEDSWNVLFMTLTDLQDARAHAKLLVSELRGFPAARTVALDVLLERAERSARHAISQHDRALANVEPGEGVERQHYFDLATFVERLDGQALPSPPAAPNERWLESSVASAPQAVDPLWVLARCLRTLEGVPATLRLELEAEGVPRVRANAGLLAQLLRNVLRNAFEAMEGVPEPALRVRCTRHRDFVELCLADSGRGALGRELERGFDPFFSTKEEHLGLGLTVARRLALRMEGRLDLEREAGGGVQVRLLLPVADKRRSGQRSDVGQRPSLLLVHQPERAAVLQRALSDAFQVTSLRPDEAIRHMLGGARHDLILCALVTPEMTGISFASALALAHPAQAERLVVLVPPDFGRETSKLLEQLHLWHVDEALPTAELEESLHGLLRLWRSLRLR